MWWPIDNVGPISFVFALGVLACVFWMARTASRRPLSFYLFVGSGFCTALVPMFLVLAGWDGESVVRVMGVLSVVSGLLWSIWKFDEKYG